MAACAHGGFALLRRRICDVAHHGVGARPAPRRVPQHILCVALQLLRLHNIQCRCPCQGLRSTYCQQSLSPESQKRPVLQPMSPVLSMPMCIQGERCAASDDVCLSTPQGYLIGSVLESSAVWAARSLPSRMRILPGCSVSDLCGGNRSMVRRWTYRDQQHYCQYQ